MDEDEVDEDWLAAQAIAMRPSRRSTLRARKSQRDLRPVTSLSGELSGVPTVCSSLRQAIESLDADRDFLKKGDVFTDHLIDGYIELKEEETLAFEQSPHPIEFQMYYSS